MPEGQIFKLCYFPPRIPCTHFRHQLVIHQTVRSFALITSEKLFFPTQSKMYVNGNEIYPYFDWQYQKALTQFLSSKVRSMETNVLGKIVFPYRLCSSWSNSVRNALSSRLIILTNHLLCPNPPYIIALGAFWVKLFPRQPNNLNYDQFSEAAKTAEVYLTRETP